MAKKTLINYGITIFAYLAVLYPLWASVKSYNWALDLTFIPNLFPLFGLVAFSILWLHAISGVFEPWLRKYTDFDSYVHYSSLIVLVSIILHPLLLLIGSGFNLSSIFLYGKLYIWLGITGWILLITYDIGKALKKYNFFVKNWNSILVMSTIGFLLTFFHSLGIGNNLQAGPLRAVWIFYGVTAIASTIYTYGVKRLL